MDRGMSFHICIDFKKDYIISLLKLCDLIKNRSLPALSSLVWPPLLHPPRSPVSGRSPRWRRALANWPRFLVLVSVTPASRGPQWRVP